MPITKPASRQETRKGGEIMACGCCGLAGLTDCCPNCLPSWCAECGACRAHCQCGVFEPFVEEVTDVRDGTNTIREGR